MMTYTYQQIIELLMGQAYIFGICSIIALAFCIVDLWDGVRTAHSVGERIRSHKLRKTLDKFLNYWAFIIIGALIDICLRFCSESYTRPYVTLVVTVIIGGIEMHSLFEHARKRKDASAKIEDVLREIIKASTKKEAKEILPQIFEVLNKTSENTTNEKEL